MASSEITPGSTEPFRLTKFTAHGDPVQEAESANAAMTHDVIGSPSKSDTIRPSSTSVPPSQEIVTTMSTPCRQPQSASGTSMPQFQYVPIQPKVPIMPRHTEFIKGGKLEKATKLPQLSSGTALTSLTISAAAKGKRKRPQSAQMQRSDIPKGFLCTFPISGKPSPGREQCQTTSRKKIKSIRACLRCQIYKEQVGQYRSLRQLPAM